MADVILHKPQAYRREQVMITGRFTTDGSGDPTVTDGRGFTVSRPSVGTYRVTLNDAWAEFNFAAMFAEKSSAARAFFEVESLTQSNGYVDFRCVVESAGTLAEANLVSAAATFCIIVRNSAVE